MNDGSNIPKTMVPWPDVRPIKSSGYDKVDLQGTYSWATTEANEKEASCRQELADVTRRKFIVLKILSKI